MVIGVAAGLFGVGAVDRHGGAPRTTRIIRPTRSAIDCHIQEPGGVIDKGYRIPLPPRLLAFAEVVNRRYDLLFFHILPSFHGCTFFTSLKVFGVKYRSSSTPRCVNSTMEM